MSGPTAPSLGSRPKAQAETRVLVAEDIDVLRSMIVDYLDDAEGFEVCGTAVDGLDVVEAALRLRPDVIVMDLKMPRKDGMTAAKEIMAVWPEAKIVINSAYGDASLVDAATSAGVVGYITKDRRPAELVQLLKSVRHQSF